MPLGKRSLLTWDDEGRGMMQSANGHLKPFFGILRYRFENIFEILRSSLENIFEILRSSLENIFGILRSSLENIVLEY